MGTLRASSQTDADNLDRPTDQGFRAVLRCRWRTDAVTGRPVARWEETLELWPAAPTEASDVT